MGLDITAYENLRPAQIRVEVDEYGFPTDYKKFRMPTKSLIELTERDFPGRTQGITGGTIYQIGDAFGFRAGSYSGYSTWRNWLARLADFRSAQDVWDSPPTDGAFIELVNFSDCEGVIGSTVAAKLAQDFADYGLRATEITKDDAVDWNMQLYRQWRRAFEMAARNGAVAFH